MQILNVATAVMHIFCMWQQLSFGNNALFFLIIIGLYSVLHNCKVYFCITNTAQILQVFTSFSLHYVTCICCL